MEMKRLFQGFKQSGAPQGQRLEGESGITGVGDLRTKPGVLPNPRGRRGKAGSQIPQRSFDLREMGTQKPGRNEGGYKEVNLPIS